MKRNLLLKKYVLIIIGLCALITRCNDSKNVYEEDNGIIILNDNNFEEVVNKFEYMLIEFYAPWCIHCQEFEPLYKQISLKLKTEQSKIRFAKIDATTNIKTAELLKVEGFPTLILHYKDINVEYEGLREEKELLSYINSVLNIPYIIYTNTNDIDKHCLNYSRIMISTFTDDNTEATDILKKASIANPALEWINCNSNDCITRYKENTIRMYIPLNKSEFIYPNNKSLTYDNLNTFLETYSVGILTPLDEYAMSVLFRFKRPVIFYFKHNLENENAIINVLKHAENKHRDKYIFLIIDLKSEEDIDTDFIDLFEITEEEIPRFQIVKFKDEFETFENYCMNQEIAGNITEELVEEFIEDYENGDLFKEPLSERIPMEGDLSEGFDRIVSKTFYKKVVFSNVTYMMLFVNDKCEEEDEKCMELIELWRKLGRKYFNNKEARFGYINFSHNEIYQFNIIERYPSLYLYLTGNKNDPIEYEGKWEKEAIEKWMGKWIGWEKVPEDLPEEEEEFEEDNDSDDNEETLMKGDMEIGDL